MEKTDAQLLQEEIDEGFIPMGDFFASMVQKQKEELDL